MNAIAVVAPGNIEILAARCARPDEDRVVVLRQEVAETVHRRVQAHVDPHVDDGRDLLVKDLRRQAERRDVRPHEPTRHVVLLEDDDLVPDREEVVGDRQRGRAGADAHHPAPVLLLWDEREAIGEVTAEIRSHALEAADRDRGAVDSGAAAGGLAGAIAGSPQDPREDVRLPVRHVGIRVSPLSDQPDVFGDVRVGRTCPLAVDHPMKVVRVASVGWIHLVDLIPWTGLYSLLW